MPIHVEAKAEQVAKVVLLVGNPQRAQYIAENYFEESRQFNEYRLMYGYTGTYKGKRVSVQTTGMGTPSTSIIVEELNQLKVKSLIRLGTCGAINADLEFSQLIIATAAHSSHNIYHNRFMGASFSAAPDFELTRLLYEQSLQQNARVDCGAILTSEIFYEESLDLYKKLAAYGTLAVEMESYALFTLASKYQLKSATVLTVSDKVFKSKRADKQAIKKGVDDMTRMTLDAIIQNYDYLQN